MTIKLIDGQPIIGTLLATPAPQVNVAVTCFFQPCGLSDRLASWVKSQANRLFDWVPRYGAYTDCNIEGKHPERRLNGQTEVYAPNGLTIPPDGWVVRPHFTDWGVYLGQMAYEVKGVRWLGERVMTGADDIRPALVAMTGRKMLVTYEVKMRVTGTKNAASTGTYGLLDFYKIYR